MGRTYTYSTGLSWGGDVPTAEVDVEVSFTVAWGSPETGRFGPVESYDPGSASEVEDIKLLTVNGKPRPWGMYSGYVRNEDDEFEADVIDKLEAHHDDMLREAAEIEADREIQAQEYRAEARREMFQ